MNPKALFRRTPTLLLFAALFPGACGGERADAPATSESEALPQLAPGELGALSADRVRLTLPWGGGRIRNQGLATDTLGILQTLTVSAAQGFDRITAEFDGPHTAIGYEVSPGGGPVESCGSQPAETDGEQHWLNVRFVRLTASREVVEGIAEIRDLRAIREIRISCVQDDVLQLAIRLNSPGRHRVIEARNPNAVVIDVER